VRLRHIGQGIMVSVSGAAIWLFWYLEELYQGPYKWLSVAFCTIFGVVLSAVYVVPLCAALGLFVPDLARRYGAALGLLIVVGISLLIAALTSVGVTLVFKLIFVRAFLSMAPVCASVLGLWFLALRRRAKAALGE
jgi:hypothetical protein